MSTEDLTASPLGGARWSALAEDLLGDLMTGPPDTLKESATRAVVRAAEASANDRGAIEVGTVDVVGACIAVTPEPFRPGMFHHLAELGINLADYGV